MLACSAVCSLNYPDGTSATPPLTGIRGDVGAMRGWLVMLAETGGAGFRAGLPGVATRQTGR